jgi:hypothetical protein
MNKGESAPVESDRAQVCIGRPQQLVLRHACPNATRLYPNDGLEWHRFALTFEDQAFRANLVLDTWLSSLTSFLDGLKVLDRDLEVGLGCRLQKAICALKVQSTSLAISSGTVDCVILGLNPKAS